MNRQRKEPVPRQENRPQETPAKRSENQVTPQPGQKAITDLIDELANLFSLEGDLREAAKERLLRKVGNE